MTSKPTVGGPDRLTSWKEIAAYLGKGVRTVQRWEEQYGLPVNRLGKEGGEIVWASRSELDTWLLERAQEIRETPSAGREFHGGSTEFGEIRPEQRDAPPAVASPASDVPSAGPRGFNKGYLLAGFALLLTIGVSAGWALFKPPPETHGQPAIAKVAGGQLHVFDAAGKSLYSRPFPFVDDAQYETPLERQASGGKLQFRDVDKNGSIELLLGVIGSEAKHAFYLLDERGHDIATVKPRETVRFGETEYGGPWMPFHVFPLDRASGSTSIFVVFIHNEQFPTLLLELDSRGQEIGRYWSNGYIESVALAQWNGRETLFVGGTSNDARGGSLAIFVDGHLKGSSPSASADKRCTSCSSGAPDQFLVFPTSELLAGVGQSTIARITVEEGGRVRLRLVEGAVSDLSSEWRADLLYTFDASLMPQEVVITSGFVTEHQRREKELGHRLGAQDELATQPVRVWRAGRYVDLARAAVGR